MGTVKIFTEQELEYIRLHYPFEPISDVADHLGVSPGTVSRNARLLGLEKDKSFDVGNYRNRYVSSYKHGRITKKSMGL